MSRHGFSFDIVPKGIEPVIPGLLEDPNGYFAGKSTFFRYCRLALPADEDVATFTSMHPETSLEALPTSPDEVFRLAHREFEAVEQRANGLTVARPNRYYRMPVERSLATERGREHLQSIADAQYDTDGFGYMTDTVRRVLPDGFVVVAECPVVTTRQISMREAQDLPRDPAVHDAYGTGVEPGSLHLYDSITDPDQLLGNTVVDIDLMFAYKEPTAQT